MFKNEALATKYLEMRDSRPMTKSKLKGSLAYDRSQEHPIGHIASSRDRLSPKPPRCGMLI